MNTVYKTVGIHEVRVDFISNAFTGMEYYFADFVDNYKLEGYYGIGDTVDEAIDELFIDYMGE